MTSSAKRTAQCGREKSREAGCESKVISMFKAMVRGGINEFNAFATVIADDYLWFYFYQT